MTFCNHCGAQLEGDERFCMKCGSEVKAARAAAAAPAPVVQPMAAVPQGYASPGQVPIAVVLPPQAPAKRSGLKWAAIVMAVLAAGYYYSSHQTPSTPAQPPAPAQSPAQINAALVKQQLFADDWQTVYGVIQVSNGRWTNNSKVAIQSATLECDQYAANGADLAQMRTSLNGPVQPGATSSFGTFQMGSVAEYMHSVHCAVVHVQTAN